LFTNALLFALDQPKISCKSGKQVIVIEVCSIADGVHFRFSFGCGSQIKTIASDSRTIT
jgi:hypothetical protein